MIVGTIKCLEAVLNRTLILVNPGHLKLWRHAERFARNAATKSKNDMDEIHTKIYAVNKVWAGTIAATMHQRIFGNRSAYQIAKLNDKKDLAEITKNFQKQIRTIKTRVEKR